MKIFTLKSSDSRIFQVDEMVVKESLFLKSLVDEMVDGSDASTSTSLISDGNFPTPIFLPLVSGEILEKVILYCRYQAELQKSYDEQRPVPTHEIKNWHKEFVNVDEVTLYNLILAANYLNIEKLLELTCQTVADMMKGMSPEQIAKNFNITTDYTPEEEEAIKKDINWALSIDAQVDK